MGRAERRRSERRARIDDRKNKILVTREELNKIKEEISYKMSGYSTENLMICFALALSRHGFDEDDIAECLEYIDHLMDDIVTDKHTLEDYAKELEDTTGIVIKCKED